jgi:trehalose-6-phosphatase
MAATDPNVTIAALRAELADQAARAAGAVAAAQDHAVALAYQHAADLVLANARIAELERRVWWLDHWGFDPEAFMRTRRGRALWAAVRVLRAARRR